MFTPFYFVFGVRRVNKYKLLICASTNAIYTFDPSDTELLRALHSRNSKNIRNPLIFLQKMAPYSCFGRVPSSKILLQASLHRIYDLLTLVSYHIIVKKLTAIIIVQIRMILLCFFIFFKKEET